MYPTIEEAVSNRLRIYRDDYAANLAPLLVEQLPLRLGIALAQLVPIDQRGARHCPILTIAGSADRHTPLVETQAYFRGNAVSQVVVDPSTGRPMSTCMPSHPQPMRRR